jgi:pimeloyl-ACP methyl ester carboxylesterase
MTDDVQVRTVAAGRPCGPLVVLAHGLEDTWRTWGPLARRLDPAWRVVVLDLPWRAGNDYRWRARTAGDWLTGALDRLPRRPDLLVAHSFSANTSLELMASGADLAGRAVLLCPLYRSPDLQATWKVFERSRDSFTRHIRDGLRTRLGQRIDAIDPELFEVMVARATARVGPIGFLTAFDVFVRSGDLRLADITLPLLVIGGSRDHTFPTPAAKALIRDLPHATVRLEDSYDHFCHVRQADSVAAQVLQFADDLGARAAPAGSTKGRR